MQTAMASIHSPHLSWLHKRVCITHDTPSVQVVRLEQHAMKIQKRVLSYLDAEGRRRGPITSEGWPRTAKMVAVGSLPVWSEPPLHVCLFLSTLTQKFRPGSEYLPVVPHIHAILWHSERPEVTHENVIHHMFSSKFIHHIHSWML